MGEPSEGLGSLKKYVFCIAFLWVPPAPARPCLHSRSADLSKQ